MLPPCWSRILAEGSFAKGPRSKVPGPAECAKRLNPPPPTGEPSVLNGALECSWSKMMEVKLESMVNHLEQACAFRRAYCSCFGFPALFLPYRPPASPRSPAESLQEPPRSLKRPPRQLQERSKRLQEAFLGPSASMLRFGTHFGPDFNDKMVSRDLRNH